MIFRTTYIRSIEIISLALRDIHTESDAILMQTRIVFDREENTQDRQEEKIQL